MKKLLVAVLAMGLMASPALASNGGGKKKAKKKAKVECNKSCDIKNCDPKNCDPKNCDPKNCKPNTCQFPCSQEQKSSVTPVASKQ